MKRYGFIFEKIITMENLKEAHRRASKGKRHYREVKMVDGNPDYYLGAIQQMLIEKTYVSSKYSTFKKYDKGKERIISKLPYYPDRIIHWALMLQTSQYLTKGLIRDTYGAIPGRGVHDELRRVRNTIASIGWRNCYYLQVDIEKFFPSIKPKFVKEKLKRLFKDRDILWLFEVILDSHGSLPIGNYPSQLLSNFLLSELDHTVSENSRVNYFRYMDDILLLSNDRDVLLNQKRIISGILSKIELQLRDDSIFAYLPKKPIDLLGYVVYKEDVVQIRNRIFQKSIQYIENFQSLSSYMGIVMHSTLKRLLDILNFRRENLLQLT